MHRLSMDVLFLDRFGVSRLFLNWLRLFFLYINLGSLFCNWFLSFRLFLNLFHHWFRFDSFMNLLHNLSLLLRNVV